MSSEFGKAVCSFVKSQYFFGEILHLCIYVYVLLSLSAPNCAISHLRHLTFVAAYFAPNISDKIPAFGPQHIIYSLNQFTED